MPSWTPTTPISNHSIRVPASATDHGHFAWKGPVSSTAYPVCSRTHGYAAAATALTTPAGHKGSGHGCRPAKDLGWNHAGAR